MRAQYNAVAKGAEWRWFHNKADRQWYLHLAGHRVATVRGAFAGYGAWCPGGLVAHRKTEAGAKRAAVEAVRAWLINAEIFSGVEPSGNDA
jgi:hypothetical protein